jgi:hypothetical protein
MDYYSISLTPTHHVGFVVKSLTQWVFICLRAHNNEQTKTDDVHHALTSITNETKFWVSHGPTTYYSTSCLFSSTLYQLGKHVDIFSSEDEMHTLTQVLNITSIILNQEMIIEHANQVLGPLLISIISKILYKLSSNLHPKTWNREQYKVRNSRRMSWLTVGRQGIT